MAEEPAPAPVPTLDYHDAYLAPLIANNVEWENRALADVAELGTFPDPWPDKLTVLRAYLLCCLESAASAEDVFSLRLKQYQTEWKETLGKRRPPERRRRATGSVAVHPRARLMIGLNC
jgi:hypothetical protein